MKRLPDDYPATALVSEAGLVEGSLEPSEQVEPGIEPPCRCSTGGAWPPLEDFASTVAHELRSPLAIVQIAAATVLERRNLLEPDQMVEVLRTIQRNSSLATLVLERLELTRELGVGNVSLERELVDVAKIVRETTSDLTDVLLTWHPTEVHAPATVVVHADPTAVRAIVFNLLSNAAKYSLRGTRIDLSVAQGQDETWITVRDRGCGVPSADAERIFEKYQQGDPGSPGVGLGLYVSRGLARAHGGDVEVCPGADVGSEFRLTLPNGTRGGIELSPDRSTTAPQRGRSGTVAVATGSGESRGPAQ